MKARVGHTQNTDPPQQQRGECGQEGTVVLDQPRITREEEQECFLAVRGGSGERRVVEGFGLWE